MPAIKWINLFHCFFFYKFFLSLSFLEGQLISFLILRWKGRKDLPFDGSIEMFIMLRHNRGTVYRVLTSTARECRVLRPYWPNAEFLKVNSEPKYRNQCVVVWKSQLGVDWTVLKHVNLVRRRYWVRQCENMTSVF